jgi:hypothetical protein
MPQLEERNSGFESRVGPNWRLWFFVLLGVALLGLAGAVWILHDADGALTGG